MTPKLPNKPGQEDQGVHYKTSILKASQVSCGTKTLGNYEKEQK